MGWLRVRSVVAAAYRETGTHFVEETADFNRYHKPILIAAFRDGIEAGRRTLTVRGRRTRRAQANLCGRRFRGTASSKAGLVSDVSCLEPCRVRWRARRYDVYWYRAENPTWACLPRL
jgi:hypothetical protein